MHSFLSNKFTYARPNYSIHSLDDVKGIVYRDKNSGTVYSGAQSRIIRLTKQNPKHTSVYNWFADEIYKYLNNGVIETISSFDKWHKDLCCSFISRLSKIGITAEYGMAQKYVNLTMKYVYCFGDSNTININKFQFCHVILDGYTYYPSSNRAKYKGRNNYSGYIIHTPFYVTDVKPVLINKSLTSWSKLSYGQYIDIQNDIRDYFVKRPLTYGHVAFLDVSRRATATITSTYVLTPFEAEFFIW